MHCERFLISLKGDIIHSKYCNRGVALKNKIKKSFLISKGVYKIFFVLCG